MGWLNKMLWLDLKHRIYNLRHCIYLQIITIVINTWIGLHCSLTEIDEVQLDRIDTLIIIRWDSYGSIRWDRCGSIR